MNPNEALSNTHELDIYASCEPAGYNPSHLAADVDYREGTVDIVERDNCCNGVPANYFDGHAAYIRMDRSAVSHKQLEELRAELKPHLDDIREAYERGDHERAERFDEFGPKSELDCAKAAIEDKISQICEDWWAQGPAVWDCGDYMVDFSYRYIEELGGIEVYDYGVVRPDSTDAELAEIGGKIEADGLANDDSLISNTESWLDDVRDRAKAEAEDRAEWRILYETGREWFDYDSKPPTVRALVIYDEDAAQVAQCRWWTQLDDDSEIEAIYQEYEKSGGTVTDSWIEPDDNERRAL